MLHVDPQQRSNLHSTALEKVQQLGTRGGRPAYDTCELTSTCIMQNASRPVDMPMKMPTEMMTPMPLGKQSIISAQECLSARTGALGSR